MRTKADKLAVLAPVRAERNKAVIEQPYYELVYALQTTLDMEQLLEAFSLHLSGAVPHDAWHYRLAEHGLEMTGGSGGTHSCNYQLRLEDQELGEWRAVREYPFSDTELATIEAYLCRMVYPLRNALLYRRAVESAYLDPLTRTRNRGALFSSLQREWELARRHGQPLSVIMLDVDHFKAVNDTYGHAVGDAVLKQVADCITRCVRASDIVFRYGGEEFLILLSNTPQDGAMHLAERIRLELARHTHVAGGGTPLRVTASLGVAALYDGDSKELLLTHADQALYRAKHGGRNRVEASLH
jgi:diguanylate cyclase (GGDEF)-like protein